MEISRGCYYYKPVEQVDLVEKELLILAKDNPRYGCRKLYQMLRLKEIIVNHKKVARIYKLHKLHLRVKQSKRLRNTERHPLIAPASELHTSHDSLGGLTPMKYKEKYGANLSILQCAQNGGLTNQSE